MTSPAPDRPSEGPDLLDGRYRLEDVVGQGGYARVYRAVDETLGRRVAVKLFTVDAPDTRDQQRRASETRLLAALSNESLVTLFDARLDVEPAFIVMEFIDGPTLREVVAEAPLDSRAAARLAVELGEALQVIHAAGVVHRDIKPSNVMMRPTRTEGGLDRAMLADFGIASLVDSTRVTATGTLVGTAAYLSPEQARGDRAGAASDIYSFGLLLLEALTAERVFAQKTPHEALAARLARPPAIPPHLPRGWRTLLSAMTALDPAHRPDAAAVTRAARRLQEPDAGVHPARTLGTASATAIVDHPTAPMSPTSGLEPTALLDPTARLDATTILQPTAAAFDRRRSLPRWVLWVAAALIVAAIAVAIAIAVASGASPAPEPNLPDLPDPLSSHFDDLWRTL